MLGAHRDAGQTTFRVWAPDAEAVSVVGDGNGWTAGVDRLAADPSGVWRGTFEGYGQGDRYKYAITARYGGHQLTKADPVAFATEHPPATASMVWAPAHEWGDGRWMEGRSDRNRVDRPLSIYEVHLGSWCDEPGGYRALGPRLAEYCIDLGFTHVELLPLMEHPFYGSWGYQSLGYFAPTARYGPPDDLMALVDSLHQAEVGVILDWVPSHFPVDDHGLGMFDGTHLYEHADPRQGFHPDWRSYVFNYDRPEVRSFLLSSAHYWFEMFHVDGLRVDAVASMLYLDYSRNDGEWVPNAAGGRENHGAIELLAELNRSVSHTVGDVLLIAEESTAWPGVTSPVPDGGLGFDLKWDMGWMNDTLSYFRRDPVHRAHHHDELTFRAVYGASEQYLLPLSHDEVVHGKGSLLAQMPGDRWQQLANLRLLLGYQWAMPGKKLLFMGAELATPWEWSHEGELPWGLLAEAGHWGMQRWVARLNEAYRDLSPLWQRDRDADAFRWIVGDDRDQSVFSFARWDGDGAVVVAVVNATPVPRASYRIGVDRGGPWRIVVNSDDGCWGGSAWSPDGEPGSEKVEADPVPAHGFDRSIVLDLPPLGFLLVTPS